MLPEISKIKGVFPVAVLSREPVEQKKQELLGNQAKPNVAIFPKAVFWDTSIDMIDWHKQKRAVIRRIFERGAETEIKEIISFYGEETVAETLFTVPKYLPSLAENAKQYLGIDLKRKILGFDKGGF